MFYLFQTYVAFKCFMLFGELGGAGSDGGMARMPGNGARRAGGRRTWRVPRWGWRSVHDGAGPTDGGRSNRGNRVGLHVRGELSERVGAALTKAGCAGCASVRTLAMAIKLPSN